MTTITATRTTHGVTVTVEARYWDDIHATVVTVDGLPETITARSLLRIQEAMMGAPGEHPKMDPDGGMEVDHLVATLTIEPGVDQAECDAAADAIAGSVSRWLATDVVEARR